MRSLGLNVDLKAFDALVDEDGNDLAEAAE